MRHEAHRVREVVSKHTLVLGPPRRRIRRKEVEREADRAIRETRVDPAATIKPSLGVSVVEVVNDPTRDGTLVFVQRMLEATERARVPVEHDVASDVATRVRE